MQQLWLGRNWVGKHANNSTDTVGRHSSPGKLGFEVCFFLPCLFFPTEFSRGLVGPELSLAPILFFIFFSNLK